MSDLLPFIISGLVIGSVYGLAAVGLVLTYKTSGLFNFAYGALAAVSAYLFYEISVQHDVPWPIAAAICVFVLGPLLGLLFERLARIVVHRSLALSVASTIGVVLIVEAAAVLIYGRAEVRTVPVFLAEGGFTVLGTNVQYSELITFVFAAAVTSALYVFFRVSRVGTAMRAVVESPDLLEIEGTSATAVRRYAWIIGMCFATACGVLVAPVLPLDPILLTLMVVQAFGAAAIGAFRSLPLTFVGGLVIGVASALGTKYFTSGFLAGIAPSLPFIVLFIVLLVFPRKYLTEHVKVIPVARSRWVTPLPVQLAGGLVVLVALAFVPSFAGVHLIDWTVGLAMIVLFLALGLLVRTAGQVSLCHVTFMAIGVAVFGQLTTEFGVPWFAALIISSLVLIPVGALIAIPAIRLSPLYLALATLGFAIFVQYMFYTQSFMFGVAGAGIDIPRPGLFESDTAYYYLVLGLAVCAALLVVVLNRSRLGRLLRGIADSPIALDTNGASTRVTWVLLFCISAALAGAAGVLAGAAQGNVGALNYNPVLSFTYLALVIIVVGNAPWYAVIAGLGLIIPPSYLSGETTAMWLQLAFGAGAILYAITPEDKRGTPPALQRALDSMFRRRGNAPAADAVAATTPAAGGLPAQHATTPERRLEVQGLTVRFGGLVAVRDVSLQVPTGRITGLIGPNGAGKTTLFNVCSGLVTPAQGTVLLGDHVLGRSPSAARARHGLGRTFQQMQLFESLTVWDNVAIGVEGGLAGANPLRHVAPRLREAQRVRAATADALELCGLTEHAHTQVSVLSTGQRRLVELARCLAGPFDILLLDEPSSGLDPVETAAFAAILEQAVARRGVGILLVEHDMSLVMRVCDYIYVLDFGNLVFDGEPRAVRESEIVRAAYLGSDEIEATVAAEEPAP